MDPSTSNTINSKQPSIQAPGYHLPTPTTELSGAIELPFQFMATTFGSAETLAQITLSSSAPLTKMMSSYRHCKLTQCSAELTPNAGAIANPLTVNLVWVPANSTASPPDILNVYGGSSFVLGGAITAAKTISVPLPANSVNLMLKDSVLYSDTPKLLAYSPAPTTPSKTPTATLQIRGRILLSSPLLQSS
ncbi:putative coat protein [tomato blistering mosaic tymovirus]|uniref:Capsid protein n=2 Tax=tomato blistering mosaic tymovirus TaxID=2035014 RepID=S5I7A5_9VIRU|nr:putative coat protein [Tomato blistering mosaic virus]AGQ80924.1 putative coat protein [Tomato blistering mosaic virus]BAL04726.1 coat protein [Tomato blistering mosaic virus]